MRKPPYLWLVIKTAFTSAADWTQFWLFVVVAGAGFVRFSAPASRAATIAGKITEVIVSAETAAILFGSIVAARLVAAPYLIWHEDQKQIESLQGSPLDETTMSVAASASSVMLLAASPKRKGATIYNKSSSPLFVKFGAEASSLSYKVEMAPGGYYEFPHPVYQGPVYGVWMYANGGAQVTQSA